jgi:hypothetical protein
MGQSSGSNYGGGGYQSQGYGSGGGYGGGGYMQPQGNFSQMFGGGNQQYGGGGFMQPQQQYRPSFNGWNQFGGGAMTGANQQPAAGYGNPTGTAWNGGSAGQNTAVGSPGAAGSLSYDPNQQQAAPRPGWTPYGMGLMQRG